MMMLMVQQAQQAKPPVRTRWLLLALCEWPTLNSSAVPLRRGGGQPSAAATPLRLAAECGVLRSKQRVHHAVSPARRHLLAQLPVRQVCDVTVRPPPGSSRPQRAA